MKRIIAFFLLSLLPFLSLAQGTDRQSSRRMTDWAGFDRYAEANRSVGTQPLVVFMGDSITEMWEQRRPSFFLDHNYLCRGIGGQSVEHMLARFQSDVVDHHPKAVVILGGINNIAGNNGRIAPENIVGCIRSMCEIARSNGITPILCSLLPCNRFFWVPDAKPAQDVIRLNGLLKAYADRAGVTYVDYHSQMSLPDGSMPAEYSSDGCHPVEEGFVRMEEILVPEIERVLTAPQRPVRASGPTDWANFKRYEEQNAALKAAPLLVLMGDSITDNWASEDPDFFEKNPFVGRGISGQTASQMLVRFRRDVIDLKPKAVAIMAGTNDLCQQMASMAYYPDDAITGNIAAMCELAEAAGIKVLLCSVTPCAHYIPIPDVDAGSRIVALNAWLKSYADTHRNVTYVDYFTPLANAENGLDPGFTYDGIHPAVNLYDDMERILVESVRKVLKVKGPFYTLPSEEADRRKADNDADRRAKGQPMTFEDVVGMMRRMR